MKVYFRFEHGEDLYSDVVEIPDSNLVELDSIERQEFINNEYLEWLSQHIDFDWEVVDEEESE